MCSRQVTVLAVRERPDQCPTVHAGCQGWQVLAHPDTRDSRGHGPEFAARRLNLSNARAEAMNNRVKLIVRRAYGFHSANAALALVHLTCGPITLTLPHEQTFA